MKKILMAVFLLTASLQLAKAQSFSLGTSLVYGDDIEEFGWNLRGMVHFTKSFGVVAEYTTFHHHDEQLYNEIERRRLWELNLNAEYNFHIWKGLAFYPFLGFNYSHELEDIKMITHSETEHPEHHDHHEKLDTFGMNLGAGSHYQIGRFEPFIEYAHLFSELPQNSFAIGLMFHLSKHTSHNEHSSH